MPHTQWNNLFLEWLKDLSENEPKTYGYSNPVISNRRQESFIRAYQSLESCPKCFQHPSQLKELKFFGEKICNTLIKKLKVYCAAEGIPMPEDPTTKVIVDWRDNTTDAEPNEKVVKKKRKPATPKQYIPNHRSGGYAILLVLRDHEKSQYFHGQGLGKSDIIRNAKAKEYCDSSFDINPGTGTFYSAWNSMNTLIKNELVYSSSSKNAHYFLTDNGRKVANKLNQASKELLGEPLSSDPIEPSESQGSYPTAISSFDSTTNTNTSPDSFAAITWPVGSFKIKVLLDNREVKSSSNRDFFSEELISNGVDVDVKALPVGDVIWAAEHKETHQQVIIDYILERKRLDDLISSIKDGRFSEQKSRLRRSALKHVIYLVEEPNGMTAGVYQQHVMTAMSQSMVIDDFFLRRTNSPEDTVKFLTSVTRQLETSYLDCPLIVIYPHIQTFKGSIAKAREKYQFGTSNTSLSTPQMGIDYDSFNISLSKTGMFTIRDMFLKMLMTIRGVSWDKAVAIQKVYPTPRYLFEAYNSLRVSEEKKNMIYEALKDNISRKRVGKVLSEKIYEIWGKSESASGQ